jgi:hypothetical protein
MGVSTDGILVFGIDLGEEIPDFLEEFEGDFDNFLDSISGLPQYGEEGHDFTKDREFRDNYGVSLTTYCSYEYPMYIIAVNGTETNVNRGYVEEINPEDMKISQEKIDKLKSFCEEYGIEWQEPKWLLASMWG